MIWHILFPSGKFVFVKLSSERAVCVHWWDLFGAFFLSSHIILLCIKCQCYLNDIVSGSPSFHIQQNDWFFLLENAFVNKHFYLISQHCNEGHFLQADQMSELGWLRCKPTIWAAIALLSENVHCRKANESLLGLISWSMSWAWERW